MSGTGEREIGTGAGGPEAWSAACPFCDADWDGEIEEREGVEELCLMWKEEEREDDRERDEFFLEPGVLHSNDASSVKELN